VGSEMCIRDRIYNVKGNKIKFLFNAFIKRLKKFDDGKK
jgi:hypothetical protein